MNDDLKLSFKHPILKKESRYFPPLNARMSGAWELPEQRPRHPCGQHFNPSLPDLTLTFFDIWSQYQKNNRLKIVDMQIYQSASRFLSKHSITSKSKVS